MSEALPAADGQPDIEAIAAALRADLVDVTTYARVLTATIGDALPAGMVDVVRRRTLGDRLAGREGVAVALVVRTEAHILTLRETEHRRMAAEIETVVRGVTISRRVVSVDEWVAVLAQELTDLARRSAAAREALRRMLGN